MLTNKEHYRYNALRQWMALPLFLMATTLFMISCQLTEQQPKQSAAASTPLPAVATTDSTPTAPPGVSSNNAITAHSSDAAPGKKTTRMPPPKIVKDAEVKEGKRFTPPVVVKDNEPEIYTKVDRDARYPGDWSRYLTTNLRGDVPIEHGAATGNYQTIVQFVVDVEGNISNAKVIKEPGYGMGAEALRVITQSGKWTPAMMNGKPVKAYRKQPITFQVTN